MRFLWVLLGLLGLTFCGESMHSVNSKTYSYLALGDSYTIGEGVSQKDSWPFQLVDSLLKKKITVNYPDVIAKTGWRTDNLLSAMQQELGSQKYDLVSVLIGVNNQYQGKSIKTYKQEFTTILLSAVDHCSTGKRGVFVLSIPDYGVTPFGKVDRDLIGQEIDQFNRVCKAVCDEFEIPFLDITQVSKRALNEENLTCKDHLHPSKKMYTLWVSEILDDVIQLVK